MRTLRRFSTATVLMFVLGVSAFAGQMATPKEEPPPPPPTVSASIFEDAALSLLQSVLSLL